ncbi:MAG: D-amino acid aminotransferase [Proteobacteria bacterium]|nr:D-amino acid aminotransferase [Pseudomonadota bacterium]
MSIAYLNGEYLPLDQARISPLDRGFLFGDGIYEYIPSYDGKLVGFSLHIERLKRGLDSLKIDLPWSLEQWREIFDELIKRNGAGNQSLYLHISRGADTKRDHAYPKGIKPTVFILVSKIDPPQIADPELAHTFKVSSKQDLRWDRCHIKSTALLGNVMHKQSSVEDGCDEALLYNEKEEITEGASSNIVVVKDGKMATPLLDHHVLPGITRYILFDIVGKYSKRLFEERVVTLAEARDADEIWVTASSKDLVPVVELDGKPLGDGKPGPVWQEVMALYSEHRFDY